MEGIFAIPSRQVFTWTLEGNSEQVRRLHHHLILRHLDVEDDLHQWRRSIAEMRNLNGYATFFAEARAKQGIHKQTRQSGESNSNKVHKEYLVHRGGSWTNTRSPLNPAMRSNRKTRSKYVPPILKKDQGSVPLMEHRAYLYAEFKNDSVPFLDYKSPCHIGHN